MFEFGLDIGGTLTKLAICIPRNTPLSQLVHFLEQHLNIREGYLLSKNPPLSIPNGEVHFVCFPTGKLSSLDFANFPPSRRLVSFATGGGAIKFETQVLGITRAIQVHHVGEIQALFDGLAWLLQVCDKEEVFTCTNVRFAGMIGKERERMETNPIVLPPSFLLVNIGSGVSFVDFAGEGKHTRVGGSSMGGATFLGLVKLLCGVNTFDEALELASLGDSTMADLLVGDIYSNTGESSKKLDDLGLRASTLAASFGRVANSLDKVKREDLALSVLIMISLNLAAMAYLHATINSNRTVIVFAGSFLSNHRGELRNTLACRTLTYGVEFWGKAKGRRMQAAFLRHEAYLGALGVLHRSCNTPTEGAKL